MSGVRDQIPAPFAEAAESFMQSSQQQNLSWLGDEAIKGVMGVDASSGFEGTNEQAKKELARRHSQLQARKTDQVEKAKQLAHQLPAGGASNQQSVPSAVLAHAPSGQRSELTKRVDIPRHQTWGVLTVCNRRRPPLLTEPAFILEGAFTSVDEAKSYMDRAVQTPGYVGAPMAIKMRQYEILAVSRERQVDANIKSQKSERLLGRFYLDMEVRQREHAQNVMQRKPGRIGLSRNFMDMRQRSEREKIKQEAMRRRVKRQARRKRRLLEAAKSSSDNTIETDFADVDSQQQIEMRASHHSESKEVVQPIHSVPAHVCSALKSEKTPHAASDEEDVSDDEVQKIDEEESMLRLQELKRLGGKRNLQYSYPIQLKCEQQSFAVISIVEDTDQPKDDNDKDAPGNEPLLMWFGCFADESTAKACVQTVMAENPDVGVVDVVPMHVPLRPQSVDLDQVEEHYKDPEQEAISAFRKSQKYAHAKFEELCEGVDLPFVDLTEIDLSPMEREQRWRAKCHESGTQAPLPRAVVDYYASVFKNNGVVPDDVKTALLSGNVEKPAVEIMNDEYDAAKKRADEHWKQKHGESRK